MCVPRGMSYSRSSPSSPVMMILRLPFVIGPNLTAPSISVITAVSPGRARFEKLDDARQTADDVLRLGVSRGILAITSPGCDFLAVLSPCRLARIGIG